MANNTFTTLNTGTQSTGFTTWVRAMQAGFTAGASNLVLHEAAVPSGTLSATTTMAYYEIYRFNDSAQSTSPIFLKVMYGSQLGGSTGTYYWKMHVQVGTANPSAGVVTDPFGNQNFLAVSMLSNVASTTVSNYISCDGSGLAIVSGLSGSIINSEAIFVVDRHRDTSSGAALTTGAFVFSTTGVGAVQIGNYSFGSSPGQNLSTIVPCVTDGNLSASAPKLNVAAQAQLYPWWSVANGSRGPSKMIVTYNENDLATLATGGVAASFLNNSHHYLTIGNRISGSFAINGEAGAAPAIWWSTP